MTTPSVDHVLETVGRAMQTDQNKCHAVIAEWLARENVELDKRTARRFFQRVYVRHGADYPWRRLLAADKQERMQSYLEWARSTKRWSQN